jgi:hypothetical protein
MLSDQKLKAGTGDELAVIQAGIDSLRLLPNEKLDIYI